MVVNFVPWDTSKNLLEETLRLYENSGTLDCVDVGDLVAIKINVGELGNPYFVNPFFIHQIVDLVKTKGGKPFITDSNTYDGKTRTNAVDHWKNAIFNGFIDAPFIAADGLKGENFRMVNSKGILKKIEVSGVIAEADSMIVVSHVKGHSHAGFGGAIKNVAIGCSSKNGMLRQHRTVDIKIDTSLCTGCGNCIKACLRELPKIENNVSVIKSKWCMSCNKCKRACPKGAISRVNTENISKAMASAAYGVLKTFKKDKVSYVNFARDITEFCDCHSNPGKKVMEDIGIFASDSPISIDAAFLKMADYTVFNEAHKIDCMIQVTELKKLGVIGDIDPKIDRL